MEVTSLTEKRKVYYVITDFPNQSNVTPKTVTFYTSKLFWLQTDTGLRAQDFATLPTSAQAS